MLEQRRPYARVIRSKPSSPADPGPYVDHNDPASPGYTERHREKVTVLPGGTIMIDYGCEGS